MHKYRIRPQAGFETQYWKIQERFMFIWVTVFKYMSRKVAEETLKTLNNDLNQ